MLVKYMQTFFELFLVNSVCVPKFFQMWWIITLLQLAAARNVFVSSPFDNFRIECPKRTAAVELSVRMVESVGAKRQDIVFDMSCEKVDELFPWVNIPIGISELEREDCYYSSMFDPITDEDTDYSCRHREYMAGITRLTDTRVQIMCCRLRSRDETNCSETVFNKPFGLSKITIIEYDNQLINAVRLEGDRYVVRFCDLAPRDIGSIYDDVKVTTTHHPITHTTTPKPYRKVEKYDHKFSTSSSNSISPSAASTSWNQPPAPPTTVASAGSVASSMMSITQTDLYRPISASASVDSGKDSVGMTLNTFNNAGDISAPSPQLRGRALGGPNLGDRAPLDIPTDEIENLEPLHPSQFDNEQMSVDLLPLQGPPISTRMSPQKPSSRNAQTSLSDPTSNWQKPKTVLNDEKLMQLKSSIEEKEEIDLLKDPETEESSTTNSPTSTASSISTEVTETAKIDVIVAERNETSETIVTTTPVSKTIDENSMEDMTMVSDLSRLTFPNEVFPKSSEKKLAPSTRLKISKMELPLKAGVSADDFLFLRPVNSEGHRRSPLRTYRPHVDVGSSEEDDGMNETINSWETTTIESPRPRKTIKILKKKIRANRHREEKEQNIEIKKEDQAKSEEDTPTTTDVDDLRTEEIVVGHTTTASPRRDLPSARKVVETMTHKVDNAHSVDEETDASPFEDETSTKVSGSHDISTSTAYDNSGTRPSLSFQADEDIEDVILKLSSATQNIRRAPVRESQPSEQFDKDVEETDTLQDNAKSSFSVQKDGSRTHVPTGMHPIVIPEMAIFEKKHRGENIVEDLAESAGIDKDAGDADEDLSVRPTQKEVTDNLVLVSSKSFVGVPPTSATEKASTFSAADTTKMEPSSTASRSTTSYNPATFYHTPVPRPTKKAKILTFCTKDVAIRDIRNMAIACGSDADIWQPSRCPLGADCLLSQDSSYRLCCPVFKG
ncbi:unnamed protein product [Cylicocyclus nassatus]|uniref:Uncharacterized protein n=1 Tax=Cylicocyclus nassatus TaxID=53992 RepID=A0AA36MDV2_CYLNA|nr:unnamed protein product [Cylicocyclus nassatus]